tara:strand:- start:97 stop:357 length:261 start_codon:yes stop_codon:yes gene_type:complete
MKNILFTIILTSLFCVQLLAQSNSINSVKSEEQLVNGTKAKIINNNLIQAVPNEIIIHNTFINSNNTKPVKPIKKKNSKYAIKKDD